MTNTKATLAIIAGVSIGAIAGILLSPDKGSATRKRIIDQTGNAANSLKDCLADFIKGKKTDLGNDHPVAPKMNLNTMG